MADRVPVFELAKRLRVKPLDVISAARRLNISVIRYAALLTPGQAQRIETEIYKNPPAFRPALLSPPPRQAGSDTRFATCGCCELPFSYPGNRPQPTWCGDCNEHFPLGQEPAERTIARLRNHEQRVRGWYRDAAARATEYEDRMKSAYRSRQKWKRALVTIVVGHEPDEDRLKCACGAGRWPCLTLQLLQYENRGVYRETERLASLDPDALERELNKHEPWRVDLLLDDDPLPRDQPDAEAESA